MTLRPRTIPTTDNNYKGECLDRYNLSVSETESVRFLAETPIKELANKQGENLLIFPHCLNAHYRDLDENSYIFDFKRNAIFTKNYLGFIGRDDVQVSIRSRFDSGENNNLMHYMLHKVFAINLFDLRFSKDENAIWDLLIFLFPHYLKRALNQGLFKKYQRFNHNDSRVKGSIDVGRHIRQNTPFRGSIAYTTREQSYDNNITQLIRHTIEYISTHKMGGANILHCDAETQLAVKSIIAATPTYSRKDMSAVMAKNIKSEQHPYYTHYTFLQRLCMQILRREKLSYGGDNSKDQIYGLLFDGAWLWEEYLNTVLSGEGYNHPQNKERKGGTSLFQEVQRSIYIDFYNDKIVLDAKYKHLDKNIDIDDLHQIISYLHTHESKVEHGGFIYPNNNPNDASPEYRSIGTLNGYGGKLHLFGLKISTAKEFKQFVAEMSDAEEKLCNKILGTYTHP